jgi:hypothetical protein
MKQSHTPGPWMLGDWEHNIFVGGGPNCDDIAEFNFADEHTVKITREEALANARLFLAALDLLAAAKAQHDALDRLIARLITLDPEFRPSKSAIWPAVVQGNAAIKAAEGDA